MKKTTRSAKSPSPTRAPSPAGRILPAPASPRADSGTVHGGTKTDFEYFGDTDTVKAFNDGRMVQHSLASTGQQRSNFFTLRGGPHYTRTLSKLKVHCLLDSVTISILDGPSVTITPADEPYEIPAGSTFSFTTPTRTALLATSLSGPGLGDPIGRIPED